MIRKQCTLLVVTALVLGLLSGGVQADQPLPSIQPTKVKAAPKIDGVLDDECWQSAVAVDNFWKLDGTLRVANSAIAKVAYDENGLYVAFRSPVTDQQTIKNLLPNQLWGEHTVEVFIAPYEKSSEYFHFAVNAVNGRYSAIGQALALGSPWESATKVSGDYWTAEVSIPFASLSSTKLLANEWRMNLTHGLSSWAPTFHTYHQPGLFGYLKGLSVPLKQFSWRLEVAPLDMVVGNCALGVQYGNHTDTPQVIGCDVKVVKAGDGKWSHNVRIPPQKQLQWQHHQQTIRVPMVPGGRYEVLASLYEGNSKKALATKFFLIEGPSLMEARWDRTFYMNEDHAVLTMRSGISGTNNKEVAWELKAADGAAVVQKGTVKFGRRRKGTLSIDLKNLPFGTYHAYLVVQQDSAVKRYQVPVSLRKLEPKPGAVQCTDDGIILRNGKPFFPFGVYYVQPYFQRERSLENEYADAGFNSHNLEWRGADSYINELKHQGAMGIIPFAGIQNSAEIQAHRFEGRPTLVHWEKAARGLVRKVAAEAGEHILAWNTWDEPPLGIWYDVTKMLHKVVREEDPYRPSMTVLNNPSIFKAYRDASDLVGVDPYPMFPGGRIRMISDWMRIIKQAMPHRPIVAVLQSFYEPSGAMPTPDEIRSMTYLSIVHGACGVYFFSYDYRVGPMKDKHPETWAALKQLAGEIRSMGPDVLLSKVSKDIWARAANHKGCVDVKLFEDSRHYYIVAVNAERESLEGVKLSIVGWAPKTKSGKKCEVLFENRSVDLKRNSWTDSFKPLAVHVYKIAK